MFLRDVIIVERALTGAELAKHGGKYLRILIDLARNDVAIPVDPAYRSKYGDTIGITDDSIVELETALASDDILANLPRKIMIKTQDGEVPASLGVIFKGKEFTGVEGKKPYNAGHLAELFMGLCVSAKFFSLGQDITADQVRQMISFVDHRIDGKNYVFEMTRTIDYPEMGNKNDTLKFLGRVPARSAEAFIEQSQQGFDPDLTAVLNSAVRYVNEADSVDASTRRVRQDKNNNTIEVVSDGTTEAKGTKADLVLKVDNKKINLLSLKTFSTDTLGQFSGLSFENLYKWFMYNFGIDITPYKAKFDPSQDSDVIYKNLLDLYDEVIYPQVQTMVEDQRPGEEVRIVRQFARAANIYARGEKLEDVEIVKLDDKISQGNYKILRFSDDLEEAMRHLDLETRYVGKGQGRTIQIWVKAAPGEKVAKGTNRLCQFRTQKMGDAYRNYFESGPALEALTTVARRGAGTRELK